MQLDSNLIVQLFPTDKKGIYEQFSEQQFYYGNPIFAIEYRKKQSSKLSIQAVYEGLQITVELIHMPKHFYKAEMVGVGIFYFMMEKPRNTYMMNGDQKIPLSVLTPVNEDEFDRACRENHFFFV